MRDGGLPDKTQRQRRHGDAQLRRGDVGVEVRQGTLDQTGTRTAFKYQLIDAGSATTGQGELSGEPDAAQ
ncbi:MAG TPA: hypothetical protein VLA19_32345 [Herpetosiphonaceae bacterium]|nr:hypothetical protein [Herpetosiphonaceae bacterium]